MSAFEYKVIPAPTKGQKAKGARSTADRFAVALEAAMNDLGAQGWDYVRADTLPCEEREGLMGKTTVYQNMLVFRRRLKSAPAMAPEPDLEGLEDANAAVLPVQAPPALLEDHSEAELESESPTQEPDDIPEPAPAPPIGTIPVRNPAD